MAEALCGTRLPGTTGPATAEAKHRRMPKEQAEEVLSLYRDKYFDLNVRHFHEKLCEEHQIGLSYTWVKQALQGGGPGKAQGQARRASQASRAASSAGDDAAHRWQRTPVVSG